MDLVLSRANGKKDFLGAGQHFVCNHLSVDLERAIANRCAHFADPLGIKFTGRAAGLLQCPGRARHGDRHTGGRRSCSAFRHPFGCWGWTFGLLGKPCLRQCAREFRF